VGIEADRVTGLLLLFVAHTDFHDEHCVALSKHWMAQRRRA
jgi:hypothetical protein